jgi:hypothetical protein
LLEFKYVNINIFLTKTILKNVGGPGILPYEFRQPEPEFVNLSRSPGIDSQPGLIKSSESIPVLLKLFTNTGSGFLVLPETVFLNF